MVQATVGVLRTKACSVIEDYCRLLELTGIQKHLDKSKEVVLKINISWHYFYPACSTTPWQLEAVVKYLLDCGYKLIAAHNKTVVVSDKKGEINNKHKKVLEKYKIKTVYLNDPGVRWVEYKPHNHMLVLYSIYKKIFIPEILIDKNIIHLPTLKTHVFTTITASMKNAFGGLLSTKRHWTHSVIHQTLVDLLSIQKEIHPGIFAVVDGTFAGDGPGPRCMRIWEKNIIIGGADQVGVDAVCAWIMGFEPLSLDFIKIAHSLKLGCGDIKKINVVGEDIKRLNFGFWCSDTFASKGQKTIYHGLLKPLEKLLLRTPLVVWSYIASILYHDVYWYRTKGKRRVSEFFKTQWGKLFLNY